MFKIIDNVKDEPSLEQAQKFVGGYVEGITFPNGATGKPLEFVLEN